MNISIGKNIKDLRKNMNIGQEVLANAVGVSVQAVSKWETGQSLPDVGIIPDIAAFFEVSIDSLFFGESFVAAGSEKLTLPNDNKLYIVQVLNGEILDKEKWVRDECISLAVEGFEGTLSVEIWGNASIKGNLNGDLNVGGNIACHGCCKVHSSYEEEALGLFPRLEVPVFFYPFLSENFSVQMELPCKLFLHYFFQSLYKFIHLLICSYGNS